MKVYQSEEPNRVDNRPLTVSRLANLAAKAIFAAFEYYHQEYQTVTRRAKTRFEERDWSGMGADTAERLDLYGKVLDQLVSEIRLLLGERDEEKLVWASMKAVYSGLIAELHDWELAETFFNSVTRRIFTTVGVDPDIEFVDTDFDSPPTQIQPVSKRYAADGSTAVLLERILTDYQFQSPLSKPAAGCRTGGGTD